jgi:hypothetical protein
MRSLTDTAARYQTSVYTEIVKETVTPEDETKTPVGKIYL